ncbi:MAG: hypothetical protein ACI9FJ_002833 [Alteromonadaceae bacterium]|jgi:hypothetical protein
MKIDSKAIVDRLYQTWGSKTYKALATELMIGESTVSSWISNSRVPMNECIETVITHGCTLDWLIFGKQTQALYETPFKEAVSKALYEACQIDLITEVKPAVINTLAKMSLRKYQDSIKANSTKCDIAC